MRIRSVPSGCAPARRNAEIRDALLDDLDRLLAQQAQAVGEIRLGRASA